MLRHVEKGVLGRQAFAQKRTRSCGRAQQSETTRVVHGRALVACAGPSVLLGWLAWVGRKRGGVCVSVCLSLRAAMKRYASAAQPKLKCTSPLLSTLLRDHPYPLFNPSLQRSSRPLSFHVLHAQAYRRLTTFFLRRPSNDLYTMVSASHDSSSGDSLYCTD